MCFAAGQAGPGAGLLAGLLPVWRMGLWALQLVRVGCTGSGAGQVRGSQRHLQQQPAGMAAAGYRIAVVVAGLGTAAVAAAGRCTAAVTG